MHRRAIALITFVAGAIIAGASTTTAHAPAPGSSDAVDEDRGAPASSTDPEPEEVARLRIALEGAEPASDDDASDLASLAYAAATSSGDRVRALLVGHPASCGRAREAIAAGAFIAPSFSADAIAEVIARESVPCLRRTLPAAQQAHVVGERLVRAVYRVGVGADADVREGVWLTLGSLAHSARAGGRAAIADAIDALVAERLREAPEDIERVEVAGNAGCAACGADLARAAKSEDPRVRRAAAGAWRFVDAGVAPMCASLGDADVRVREHAAWALRWGATEKTERTRCLTGALSDENELVREAARASLEVLAH